MPFLPFSFALFGVVGYGTLENYVGSLHAGTSVVTSHRFHPQLTAPRTQQTRLRGWPHAKHQSTRPHVFVKRWFKNVTFIHVFFFCIFGELGTLEEKFVGVTYELNWGTNHIAYKINTLDSSFLLWVLIHMYEGWNFNSGNYLFTTDTK